MPSRIKELDASEEALDLLSRMLEASTEQRIAAQEALQHPLVVQSYVAHSDLTVDGPDSKSFVMSRSLTNRSPELSVASEKAWKALKRLEAMRIRPKTGSKWCPGRLAGCVRPSVSRWKELDGA